MTAATLLAAAPALPPWLVTHRYPAGLLLASLALLLPFVALRRRRPRLSRGLGMSAAGLALVAAGAVLLTPSWAGWLLAGVGLVFLSLLLALVLGEAWSRHLAWGGPRAGPVRRPYLAQATKNLTVPFVVDRSLSIPEEPGEDPAQPGSTTDLRWLRVRNFINQAVAQRGVGRERDRAGLIIFGRRPRLELPPSDAPRFNHTGNPTAEDGNYTDIGAALKLALASFPADTGNRIVLISDGNENLGSAEEQARLAKSLGVPIDVLPLAAGARNEGEVLVERVDAPPVIEQGARADPGPGAQPQPQRDRRPTHPQADHRQGVFLSNFDWVILADVPADRISEEHQEVIRSNTHGQGCGLVMTGGPEAFGAGGWQNTPVEKALPVDSDIKSLPAAAQGLCAHHWRRSTTTARSG